MTIAHVLRKAQLEPCPPITYSQRAVNSNFFETIRRTLLQHPEQVFLVWPAGEHKAPVSYTGWAILNRTQAIREALQATPVRAGEPVLLVMPVSFDLICGLLAVMALGGIPVLPPAAATPSAILGLLRKANIRAVLTRRPLRPTSRLLAWLFRLKIIAVAHLSAAKNLAPAEPVDGGQFALVSHSSGSTGQPKAVRRSHRVLLAQHQAIKAVFPPWAGQRDFPLFPNILLHNMAAGVISILPDVPWCATQQLEPARVLDQLVRERVETMTGNVCYFNALLSYLRQHPRQLLGVVGIGIGGSPVPEPLVHGLRQFFPNAAVHVIYGSSEAEPIAVRQVSTQVANPLAGYCVGTIRPALEVQICPLGQLNNGLKPGPMVGEIQVRGPHVATSQPGQWLATGDYGYLADGQLFLTGRQGNEGLHGGVQHYQLEHLLYHLPGVERVAARSDAAEFTIFIQGTASQQDVEELLAKTFHRALHYTIQFRSTLPVDSRHHSKILYAQLT